MAIISNMKVFVGERDMDDFHRIADYLTANIPNASKQVLKGVGHSPHMQMPKELSERIIAFLDEALVGSP